MPELPEVETIRRQVAPYILGRPIVDSWARLERITRPSVGEFIRQTRDVTIVNTGRRGKQLYFLLSSGGYLLIHLGMSGRLSTEVAAHEFCEEALPRHVHGVLRFADGSQLVFTDPRTFGLLEVASDLRGLGTMGPEPLDENFDAEALARELQRHKTMIKAALLDQRRVAGLGNIYADEVCFEARVHPATRACDLSLDQLRLLVSHMRPILERAIAARGATLKDGGYQDLFGQFGEFIPKAYGNTGNPCVVCGAPIERGKLGAGTGARSYHFCPACQRVGDARRPPVADAAKEARPAPTTLAYPRTSVVTPLRRVAERP